MLKKYISFFLFALFIFTAYLAQARPVAPLMGYKQDMDSFLTSKLVNNEPITYCIYLGKPALEFTNPQDFDDTFKLAVKLWMVHTSQLIRLTGQEKGMAPVLAVLEKDPNLQLLPECDFSRYPAESLKFLDFPPSGKKVPTADLSVFVEDSFFSHLRGEKELEAFFSYQSHPYIVIPASYYRVNPSNIKMFGDKAQQFISLRKQILATPNHDVKQINTLLIELMKVLYESVDYNPHSILYVLQHELGHAFGLADQRASADNGDLIHGTINPRSGIMDNFTTYLTCDDADGIVLLLHEALNLHHERFSSLCRDGIKFSGGKEELSAPKKRVIRAGANKRARTYYPQTATDGVYLLEDSKYVSTYTDEDTKKIYYLFDFSRMPKGVGGFQSQKGHMKMLDVNNNPEKRVPVGEHVSQLTLGAGPAHKQILKEKYDDNGQLLSYTLEIYDEEVLTETRTKTF